MSTNQAVNVAHLLALPETRALLEVRARPRPPPRSAERGGGAGRCGRGRAAASRVAASLVTGALGEGARGSCRASTAMLFAAAPTASRLLL